MPFPRDQRGDRSIFCPPMKKIERFQDRMVTKICAFGFLKFVIYIPLCSVFIFYEKKMYGRLNGVFHRYPTD